MSQTKRGSVIEAVASTFIGFGISFVVWQVAGPLFGYKVTYHDNFFITSLFTVVSLVRGYYVRRLFNFIHHRS